MIGGEQPLVSAIMPTANRRRWVPHAISQFLEQDWPRRELVILDDGEDGVEDLIPNDARVRYHRVAPMILGEKFNECVRRAAGDLLLNWADDDWRAPRAMRLVAEAHLSTYAPLAGIGRMLFWDFAHGEAWTYAHTRRFLIGGSVLFTRAWWDIHPYPPTARAVDVIFRDSGKKVFLEDESWYVASIHSGNTSPRSLANESWQRWHGEFPEGARRWVDAVA